MVRTEFDELLDILIEQALEGDGANYDQLYAILTSSDDDLMSLITAVGKVRRHFFGRRVKLNYLVNLKSGMCPEDCHYCSQRLGSQADILKYSWLNHHEVVHQARQAIEAGAGRICLVASGRGPADRDIERVADTVSWIKQSSPHVQVCACLGLLQEGQASKLQQAGIDIYNHNLNTSPEQYARICSTHSFSDRVNTITEIKAVGLSPCSGAIFGMGESDQDIVNVAIELQQLNPDSVPINFLMPFEGTPMGGQWQLTPQRCLRILAMFRFAFPNTEIRVGGGREIHLRSLQPLALHIANSIFLGDYLTSEGQPGEADRQMITDAGFVIEGLEEFSNTHDDYQVVTRRRGAGTSLPANR